MVGHFEGLLYTYIKSKPLARARIARIAKAVFFIALHAVSALWKQTEVDKVRRSLGILRLRPKPGPAGATLAKKKDLNLNPTAGIDLGFTEFESYRETSSFSNKDSDALIFDKHEIITGLANIGMIVDNTVQLKNSTIKHNGRLEYIADFSPSSELQFSYVTDQSTKYNYVLGNVATHNYRIGYGFDFSTPTGLSLIHI